MKKMTKNTALAVLLDHFLGDRSIFRMSNPEIMQPEAQDFAMHVLMFPLNIDDAVGMFREYSIYKPKDIPDDLFCLACHFCSLEEASDLQVEKTEPGRNAEELDILMGTFFLLVAEAISK